MSHEQPTSSASDTQPASPQPSLSHTENTDAFAPQPQPQAAPPSRPAPFSAGPVRFFLGRDPAYRVLFVGLVLAIIVSIVVIGLLSRTFSLLPNFFGGNLAGTTQAGATTPGSVDGRPSFPTPGGQGSTQSSQPPKSGTPTILPTSPTPTIVVTPTVGQGGILTVQILDPPSVVNNNTTVDVSVNANQAGAIVQLVVIYDAPPFTYTSMQEVTDSNGNATLVWRIHVFSRASVTAQLNVTASQDGQQASSAPVTVQIFGAGTGG